MSYMLRSMQRTSENVSLCHPHILKEGGQAEGYKDLSASSLVTKQRLPVAIEPGWSSKSIFPGEFLGDEFMARFYSGFGCAPSVSQETLFHKAQSYCAPWRSFPHYLLSLFVLRNK